MLKGLLFTVALVSALAFNVHTGARAVTADPHLVGAIASSSSRGAAIRGPRGGAARRWPAWQRGCRWSARRSRYRWSALLRRRLVRHREAILERPLVAIRRWHLLAP